MEISHDQSHSPSGVGGAALFLGELDQLNSFLYHYRVLWDIRTIRDPSIITTIPLDALWNILG